MQPYGGAKYKLVARLVDHAEEGLLQAKWSGLRTQAGQGDVAAAAEAQFATPRSFAAALKLFHAQHAKLPAIRSVRSRIETLAGLTAGFDAHLLKAITGPKRAQYNGKYGELGMEGQSEVAQAWRQFIMDTVELQTLVSMTADDELDNDDWQRVCEVVWLKRPTGAYGFDTIGHCGGTKCWASVEQAISKEADLAADWARAKEATKTYYR